ncbi:MAG: Ig-like domain-containing protein [Firmicutes bacterium]|nr:Ig-like domain-containing protein [Candidatus Fiminaster equi]
MKKRSLLFFLSSLFLLGSCSQEMPQDPYEPKVTSVAVNPSTVKVELGGTPEPVSYAVNGQGQFNKDVTVASKDTSIATVEMTKGKREFTVKGVAHGNTTVDVTSVGDPTKVATVQVFVLNPGEHTEPYIDSVGLSKTSGKYKVSGEGESILVTVNGENDFDDSVTLTLTNSVPSDLTPVDEILSVDKTELHSGESFVITPKDKTGRVTIAVTSNGNPEKGAIFYAVVEQEGVDPVPPEDAKIFLYPMDKVLYTEDTLDIQATCKESPAPTITWTSSNEDVATVDASGHVVAVDEGECTITATLPDGSFNTCHISVREDPLIAPHFAQSSVDVYAPKTVRVGVTCKSELTNANFEILNNPDDAVSFDYDAENNVLVITGLHEGSCQIKVTNKEKTDILTVNCLGELPMKTWYLYPQGNWTEGNAWFCAHFWGGDADEDIKFESIGNLGYYSLTASALFENVIFVRCNPAYPTLDWEKGVWDKTEDLYIKEVSGNLYDIPGGETFGGSFKTFEDYLNVNKENVTVYEGNETDVVLGSATDYTVTVTSSPEHAEVTENYAGFHVAFIDVGTTTVQVKNETYTKTITIETKVDTRETRKLHLNANTEVWDTHSAWFYIHAWKDGGSEDFRFTKTAKAGYYYTNVPTEYTDFLIVRMNPSIHAFLDTDWSIAWGKTDDCKFDADKNLVTITAWRETTPPEIPVGEMTYTQHTHTYEYVDNVVHMCNVCGLTGAHSGGTATETSGKICEICNHVYTDPLPHEHHKVLVSAEASTCTKQGHDAYYKCDVNGCSKLFSKDDQSVEIDEIPWLPLAAHSFDSKTHECSCGELDPNYCKVTFTVTYNTYNNGCIYFVGDYKEGCWSANDDTRMTYNTGDVWKKTLTLKIGQKFECKFLYHPDSGSDRWEEIDGNRSYTPSITKTENWSWGVKN